ncbi:ankyrin repeat-containing protein NPR4-like [Mangifera indica]|uniref:ankyrin repeat-containing protein NPR4-like n=1 Tax=Mangifera indica TaxID=29780 RepID=UPI001CFBDDDF|nr:ankyrin repeat-containing protein NPR4-like [Mangifera indica]XP_044507812.1 ankyrin repeat-containing protein NPR4-like [Mangifera indica]XP_044507813.1 ankyrin repeat-containing protein NPR4-like [Mangifera indica]
MMMMNNLPSSRSEKGLSIQTCFPEIKSVVNSASSLGDYKTSVATCSDIGITMKCGFGQIASNAVAQINSEAIDYDVSFQQGAMSQSCAASGEVERNHFTAYVSLHLAALKGDWEYAKSFLMLNPRAVSASITRNQETALHIAAGARHTVFVQELVNIMTPDNLELQNKVGNTALCFAAASGIKKIAEVMVNKNQNLPSIRGSEGATPLCMAALLGHRDMVWYLYSVTKDTDLKEEDRIELLIAVINTGLFDVALDLIRHHPELAIARDGNGETALHVLARKPLAFVSGSQLGIRQRCIYSLPGIRAVLNTKQTQLQALKLVKRLWKRVLMLDDSKIGELLRKPSRLLFTAAKLGNVEFITVLIRMCPDLIWKVDDHSQSIFHIAVLHRQESIFNLIHAIGAHKDLIAAYKDENNNNMLHLTGKLAPPDRLKIDSGAALQLRRELHWFKEVEKVVQPSYRESENSEGKTPHILFSEEHEKLLREGEKWMKDTASSCMLVATLIATVMFAAAFTMPGGNDNHTGRPICLRKVSFLVFVVSNALALFSSTTAILMFLSILTSRYAEEDFLHSLPNKLIIGLAALFISIATMMVAFGTTLFLVLGKEFSSIAIPIASVAFVPVTLFAMLQFPLFSDTINHLYGFSIFSGPNHHLFY